MKKILNVLLNGQLTNLMQQITRKDNTAVMNYKLQLAPSYWKMTPSDLHIAKKRNAMPLGRTVIILLLVSISVSSCYTAGYGCRGNSRLITRVR